MARYRNLQTGRFAAKQNYKKLQKAFADYVRKVDKLLIANVSKYAPSFIRELDQFGVPIDTGNLRDSIGISLYKGGVAVKQWATNPIAIRQQRWGTFNGMIPGGRGWGKDYLANAFGIDISTFENDSDVSMILFAAIPYAKPLSDPDAVKEAGPNKNIFYKKFSHPMATYYAGWFPKLRREFISQCTKGIKKSFLEASDEFGGWSGKSDPLRFELNLDVEEL